MSDIIPDYIFETSWEVCNMVGGIYTVLSTKADTLKEQLNDKLIFIGPDLWDNKENPLFDYKPELFPEWTAWMSANYNLAIRTGRWNIPGKPLVVLVKFQPLLEIRNEIYAKAWEKTGVNSIAGYGDYHESSMFGWASGMIVEGFCKFYSLLPKNKVIAHYHEWMTAFGVNYLYIHQPQIATVFTTHATTTGRSIAGNHKPLYNYLYEYNGDQMADELNVVSKHSAEKTAAHIADSFTTVSEITALECKQLLERTPDVITPNGFDDDFVPKGKTFTSVRKNSREMMAKVTETLLGQKIEDNALFISTAGRYEFKNKGLDIFIESLKYLNDLCDLNREIIVFIMVPACTNNHRTELVHEMNNGRRIPSNTNRLTTHELCNHNSDSILEALNWFHLRNEPNSRVKVVYVPSYLNGNDGVFNLTYYQLLAGMDLTVFPSYYEPWGYTPLESTAFSVPTITTDLSGFGQWVAHKPHDITDGVAVLHRSDYNNYELAVKIAENIFRFASFTEVEISATRKKAASISKRALWKHFIVHYYEAYRIAFSNLKLRNTH